MLIQRPIRSISFDRIIIHEYYNPYEEPIPKYFILGLPDAGLVGAIASRYLVTSKNMKLIGEIDSPALFPPVTVVHKHTPMSPMQLYISDDRRMIVLVSEAPVPAPAIYPLSYAIIEYAREIGIQYILSLSGIAVPNRLQITKPKLYYLASNDKLAEEAEKLGFNKLEEGFIAGPYAVIMKESRRRNINNLAIFSESFFDLPDPEAAATALTGLSKFVGIEINVDKLLEEAELLKLQTRELMRQTKRAMTEMQKHYEKQMPLMYQ